MRGLAIFAFLPTLLPAAFAAQPGGFAVDPYYFENASSKLNGDLQGVVSILVDYEGKASSRGIKKLIFRPKPDPNATPTASCSELFPRTIAPNSDSASRPPSKAVCGIRLLGWTVDARENRIQLPVTASVRKGATQWLQVVDDPDEDHRSWIQVRTSRRDELSTPLMEYQSLGRWIGSEGSVRRRPYRELGAVLLRVSPSIDSSPVANQPTAIDAATQDVRRIVDPPKFDPDAVPLGYLGIQGAWARVELLTSECRGENADPAISDDSAPPCVAGWIPWRDSDGELFLYPIAR